MPRLAILSKMHPTSYNMALEHSQIHLPWNVQRGKDGDNRVVISDRGSFAVGRGHRHNSWEPHRRTGFAPWINQILHSVHSSAGLVHMPW